MFKKIKKGIASLTLLMILIATTPLVGCGGGETAGIYIPGTYTGEANGMGGPIKVTLTVDSNSIVSVDEITESGETVGLGGKEAIENGAFAENIMAAQSADIDGVSGATITSDGVQQAAQRALDEALNQ